eukprot:351341-Chlamydomonas_euryale.AAC.6
MHKMLKDRCQTAPRSSSSGRATSPLLLLTSLHESIPITRKAPCAASAVSDCSQISTKSTCSADCVKAGCPRVARYGQYVLLGGT